MKNRQLPEELIVVELSQPGQPVQQTVPPSATAAKAANRSFVRQQSSIKGVRNVAVATPLTPVAPVTVKSPVVAERDVQAEVAATLAVAAIKPADAVAGKGLDSGDSAGVGNVKGARGDHVAGGSAPPGDVSFGGLHGPSFSRQLQPVYPAMARRRGREGVVLLRLTINERGELGNLELLEDPGYGFAAAAMDAVRGSSFNPATHNGRPISVRAVLPVRFRLQ